MTGAATAERAPDRPGDRAGAGTAAATVPAPLAGLVGHLLRRAALRAGALFAEHAGETGVTPLQYGVLALLAERGAATQAALVADLATAPPVLVRPLKDLERRGLVRCAADTGDRRRRPYALTPAGSALLVELDRRVAAAEAALLDGLDRAERTALVGLLTRVALGPAAACGKPGTRRDGGQAAADVALPNQNREEDCP